MSAWAQYSILVKTKETRDNIVKYLKEIAQIIVHHHHYVFVFQDKNYFQKLFLFFVIKHKFHLLDFWKTIFQKNHQMLLKEELNL